MSNLGINPKKLGIMVMLDCLLDTRLSILHSVYPGYSQVVLDGDYFTREIDEFPHMSHKAFRELYTTRGLDTLREAFYTPCADFVVELAVKSLKQIESSPYHVGTKIIINTYPYRVSDEYKDTLSRVFVMKTDEFIDLEVVRIDPVNITPQYCKENLGSLVMYDYEDWLETHAVNKNFESCKIPEIQLFVPRLYFNKKPTAEEILIMKNAKQDPFRALEISATGLIDLTVLDISIFSLKVRDEFLAKKMVEKAMKSK